MGALSVADRLAARRGKIAASRSKGQRLYKWKPGKTVFRILPDKENGDFDRPYGLTWIKSFDGQQKLSIGDRYVTYGEDDPIRDMIFTAMRESPTEEIKKHFQEMLASARSVFQVLIITVNGAPDPDAPADTPQLVDVSQTQIENIIAQFMTYSDMDPTYDLASKDRGHLFSCEKSGTGFDTKYSFLATPQVFPIGDDVIAKMIDLDGWIEGEFEGREQKARELLAKTGAAAGMNIGANVTAITSGGTPSNLQIADATVTTANTGMSAAAVTTIIDAEIEEVPDEVVAPDPTPDPTPTTSPAVEAASSAAPASGSTSEIDDILAGLQ